MSVPVLGYAVRAVHAARVWPVASQYVARRNAMRAATACARRRAEREEIEAYMRAAAEPRPTPEQAPEQARRTGG